ncbi:MAG: hypothetical protein AAGB10_20525 [Pseudomonadota bacterium]
MARACRKPEERADIARKLGRLRTLFGIGARAALHRAIGVGRHNRHVDPTRGQFQGCAGQRLAEHNLKAQPVFCCELRIGLGHNPG